jgi:hypothetical protein
MNRKRRNRFAAVFIALLTLSATDAVAADQPSKHMNGSDNIYPCVSAPLPTDPVGDFSSAHFQHNDGGFELQAWRYPCDGDRSVPMMTVIPEASASPLFCADEGLMVQGMRQDNHYRLVQDPMNPDESFCGLVVVPTTLAIINMGTGTGMGMGGHNFDLDQEFTYMFDPAQQHGMDFFPYHSDDYGVGSMGHAIGQQIGLSGVWYDPDTEGQGFSIQMTAGGLIMFYFGYDAAGSRLWLISSLEVPPLAFADSMTMTLFQGAGGVFGQPMPDTDSWGQVELTFDDCDTGRAVLDGKDGRMEMALTKLAGIDGLLCH